VRDLRPGGLQRRGDALAHGAVSSPGRRQLSVLRPGRDLTHGDAGPRQQRSLGLPDSEVC